MTNKTAEHRLRDVFSAFDNLGSEHKELSAVAQSVDSRATQCTVLTVNFAEDFAWDGAIFASGAEMAFYHLKHMRRRLLAVADLKSADPS
jgi:hypothetical protein